LPLEAISPGEARFDYVRRRVGAVAAPLVFVAMLLASYPSLSPEAHRLAAVIVAVMILWISEALPMPITAMLGAAACVVLRVAPAREVLAPFADPLMFLFIGAFILARAIFVHGLDRRFAYAVLSLPWVGSRPSRILFAFGAVTTFISAWVSNTATTAMMFGIGMSILAVVLEPEPVSTGGASAGPPAPAATSPARSRVDPRWATALMLITAFGASIGGLMTPVGTPPNIIGLAFIRELTGYEISFFRWMIIGAPIVVVLFLVLFGYLNALSPAGVREIAGSREMIASRRRDLGPWTTGQRSTMVAFGATVALWVIPGLVALVAGERSEAYLTLSRSVPEGVAAIIGATLLFILPGTSEGRTITWQQAVQIDWGVVLLYGGGFALGVLSFRTGLAESVGRGLTDLLPLSGGFGLLVASVIIAVLVSETTSNTASANMVVPVVISIATAAGVDPLEPALGATIGASLGFMLPVSTPCNAIVYGSGYVPLTRMIRYGVMLDVAGIIVVVTMVRLLSPLLR
jgi:solute carrier family 13 (sodium-dependent dicarboxylate transporter), member 2/3/5